MNSLSKALSWAGEAWKSALPVYEKILRLPFITELAAGTLDKDIFMYYIRQDSLYLKDYARVMDIMAARISEPELSAMFGRFAKENIEAEKSLHAFFGEPLSCVQSPTCLFLSSHLYRQAAEPRLEVALASVLPCFLVYERVGEHILSACVKEGNPYMKWIETYSDDGFSASVAELSSICNSFAEENPASRKDMTEAFVTGTKLEWMFWNSAYIMEEWKI